MDKNVSNDSERTYNVEAIRQRFPKAYEKWGKSEDDELRREFREHIGIEQIAKLHNRKKGAIRSRLKKLGLLRLTHVF